MNVGRFEEKGEYDPRGHIPWAKITKNQYAYLWHKGKPAILAEGGVIITMKSGDHRRGLLISTKH
mgnify:CR=1 FL=1|jgi:hypothetical protein